MKHTSTERCALEASHGEHSWWLDGQTFVRGALRMCPGRWNRDEAGAHA